MTHSDSVSTTAIASDSPEILEANPETPAFGWSPYAERINGRVAMLAIAGLLVLEWFSKQDLFTWLGLR